MGRVVVFLLIGILLPIAAWAADPPPLQNGVAFNTFLNALTYANVYIDVPSGATKLTVTVTNGTGDLDLYLKFGAKLTGGTIGDLQANADARSEGMGADETITLTTTSSPPVKAGRWYIATLNLNNATTNFTLTAKYEVPGPTGVPPIQGGSLVQPGSAKPSARSPLQAGTFPPTTETKHTVNLNITPETVIPGSTFGLFYTTAKGSTGGNADMYLAAELKGVVFLFLGEQLPGDPIPVFRRNFPADSADDVAIFPPFALPSGLPQGDYNFYAVLIRAGNVPFDVYNWVSDVAFATMRIQPLSPHQEATITNYGHPSQFVKTFSITDGIVRADEVWAYGARGTAVNFINGAFIEESTLAFTGVPSQPGEFHPEDYPFDMTAGQIKQRHGQVIESTTPPFTNDLFPMLAANRFLSYDGIVFGFNNEQLVFVMSSK